MKVAISQSNYLPWRGYFDQVNAMDHFVRYDEVQYTRRDWRNRNRFKTKEGALWLSVPVATRGQFAQRIDATEVADPSWAERHWTTIRHAYARAPHFEAIADQLHAALLRASGHRRLTAVNAALMEFVCTVLGIATPVSWSTEWTDALIDPEACPEPRTRRLLAICLELGATEYWSGPAAQVYLDEEAFNRQGIEVRYHDNSGYPEYSQLWGTFEPAVSVVDLLLNLGVDGARAHMKTFG